MRITCTGHAGLFVETAAGSILCDPWRTPAYFASWFVFPDNSGIDFGALHPDYLYVSHLHRDHYDAALLARSVPRSTTILLPDYPTDDLRTALEGLGFHSFVQTVDGEPIELDGLRVMITSMASPADGPLGDSALAIDDGSFRLLNQNDARPRDFDAIGTFGHFDAHFLQYSGAIWWPVVYDLAEATKQALGVRKRENGMARAARFVETVGASYVFPNSGPAAFLDADLFGYNDVARSPENPFPDQAVFVDYLAQRGHENARLLIPGSTAELRPGQPPAIEHPIPDVDVARIFTDKKAYLEAYAERQRPTIEAMRQAWPRYDGDLAEALADWFDPLLALADRIGPGVGGPVLLEIGEESIVVDFATRQVRRLAGEECRYRFAVDRRLVEALIAEHQIDWVNSLFLSLRFRASRRGQYNEFIYTFFKCLAPERLSYAEGWYAEQEAPDDLIRIGDYMVQRRCPHLKADLERFGELHPDGVLQCGMHGWRFDLATGQCLTSDAHRIVCFPVEG
ncbi:MAG: Rieske 2Fe-2S domain-containing protein [Acidimicrobiales bacterium]